MRSYIGFDVSQEAIDLCKHIFLNDRVKTFKLMKEYNGEKADLALSIDVIYHLVEDKVYYQYLYRLFNSAQKFVIIYSSNSTYNKWGKYGEGIHIKHRKFSLDIEKNFQNGNYINIFLTNIH